MARNCVRHCLLAAGVAVSGNALVARATVSATAPPLCAADSEAPVHRHPRGLGERSVLACRVPCRCLHRSEAPPLLPRHVRGEPRGVEPVVRTLASSACVHEGLARVRNERGDGGAVSRALPQSEVLRSTTFLQRNLAGLHTTSRTRNGRAVRDLWHDK